MNAFLFLFQAFPLPSQALRRPRGAGAKSEERVLRLELPCVGYFDPGDIGYTQGCNIFPKQAEKFSMICCYKTSFLFPPDILESARYLYIASG